MNLSTELAEMVMKYAILVRMMMSIEDRRRGCLGGEGRRIGRPGRAGWWFVLPWLSLLLLSGCGQDQGDVPRPQPDKPHREQAVPAVPPVVSGDLGSLPEWQPPRVESTRLSLPNDSGGVPAPAVADKKAVLKELSAGNEALKQRIRRLEAELMRKEQVSRQLSEKIEAVRNRAR